MRLSNESEIILSLLSVNPMKLGQLITLFQAFSSRIHLNYHALETSVIIDLKRLRKLKLIRREGIRKLYVYHITNKGLKLLIQKQLKKLLLIS